MSAKPEKRTLLNLTRSKPPETQNPPSKSTGPTRRKTVGNEEAKIVDITEEIYKNYKGVIAKASHILDFSESVFQLSKLDNIFKIPKLKPEKILGIDLSNNKLQSIETLNYFSNLRTINAPSNLIKEVHLKLNGLEELNLSFNNLEIVKNFVFLGFTIKNLKDPFFARST